MDETTKPIIDGASSPSSLDMALPVLVGFAGDLCWS